MNPRRVINPEKFSVFSCLSPLLGEKFGGPASALKALNAAFNEETLKDPTLAKLAEDFKDELALTRRILEEEAIAAKKRRGTKPSDTTRSR